MANPNHSRWRKLAQAAFTIVLLLCLLITLGLSSADDSAFRSFQEAAVRWQANPEFRAITLEYCIRGSRGLRTRPLFMEARHLILAIRSLPVGVPKEFAVNETSHFHYDNFTRGPLSGYLYLCSEQQVGQYAEIFESIGQRPSISPADERELLAMFRMDFPVVSDAGALQSVGTVLNDSQANRRFTIRQPIGKSLLPYIADLARQLDIPQDVTRESPDQQQAILDRLDGYIKAHDLELWRTKQVSDFCSGIWAQVYSPAYCWILGPLILIRQVCKWTLIIGLIAVLAMSLRRKRRMESASSHGGNGQPVEIKGKARANTGMSAATANPLPNPPPEYREREKMRRRG
jgi:hypothetical protein